MILSETVDFTDRMKIHLDYDFQRHALNIFVNSTDPLQDLSMPCQINVLVNQPVTVPKSIDDDQINVYFELSTIYTYDEMDEELPDNPTSILSSCCDESFVDHDDGYSTHSSDDIEHHSLAIPPSKSLLSFDSSEFYSSFLRRLIEQMISFNPWKKTIEKMMFHPLFFH